MSGDDLRTIGDDYLERGGTLEQNGKTRTPPLGDPLLPNRTGGGMMNVREALEKFVVVGGPVVGNLNANDLAPIIERALREAWAEGTADGRSIQCGYDKSSDNGVTAGVAAMVEEA